MAYTVKYGDMFLFYPGSDELVMHDAKISQNADGIARFDFTLPPTHPAISEIGLRDLENLVEVSFDGTVLFSGFVSNHTTTLWLEESYSCVSELSLLDGVLVRYKPTSKDGGRVLAEILSMWNNLTTFGTLVWPGKIEFGVDPESQASQVGYEDPSSPSTLLVDAETTTPKSILGIIKDSMLEPYGAFIRMRKAADGTRLVGVFPNAPDTSTQVVTIGENLLDYNYTETDEEMYNACLPVGGALEHRELSDMYKQHTNIVVAESAPVGSRTVKMRATYGTVPLIGGGTVVIGKCGYALEGGSDDLTTTPKDIVVSPPLTQAVSSGASVYTDSYELYQYDDTCTMLLEDGFTGDWAWDYNICYNTPSVRQHGMKMFTFQDNDIRDSHVLFNKAKAMIIPRLDFKRSLTVTALDMAFYSSGYEHLQAGQKLRVISEPHGLDTIMYVRTADINLDDPSQTKYVLGTVERTLSRQVRNVESNVRTGSDNFIKELNNRIPQSTIQGLS